MPAEFCADFPPPPPDSWSVPKAPSLLLKRPIAFVSTAAGASAESGALPVSANFLKQPKQPQLPHTVRISSSGKYLRMFEKLHQSGKHTLAAFPLVAWTEVYSRLNKSLAAPGADF